MTIRKKVKLLVVDDHSAFSDLVDSAAEDWNSEYDIECRVVESGSKALAEVGDWSPNVILVDAYLPDMNCFEFLRSCTNWDTPLIVTSENSSVDLQESALLHGATAFVTKSSDPDRVEELMGRIAHWAEDDPSCH